MASETAPNGDKASDKSSGSDCEHAIAMTTKGNSARLGRSVAHSPLFKLSAELRNTIYRLVLVEDQDDCCVEPVVIDKISGVAEPGLLLSNKIVRSEALPIFYYENHWECEVHNFDPAPVLLLQSKLKMPFSEHPMFITITSVCRNVDRKTWRNLVSWLHLHHKGKCPSLFHGVDCHDHFGRDQRAEMALLDGLFEMARSCPEVSSKTFDRMIAPMEIAWEHCAWLSW
jgi:hypothetical protein